MSKNAHRISEIQAMIRRHEEAVKGAGASSYPTLPPFPSGHNVRDEDLSKVASAEFIGKSDPTDELRK